MLKLSLKDRQDCAADVFRRLQKRLDAARIAVNKDWVSEAANWLAKKLAFMMLERKKDTSFPGLFNILELPPLRHHKMNLDPEAKDLVLIQHLENYVAAIVEEAHRERLRAWRRSGAGLRRKPVELAGDYKTRIWEKRPIFVFPHL
jgi:hypothetical protein